MIEQVFKMTQSDEKTVEKVIQDENIHYMHMILCKGEGLPVHTTNATVYMTVMKGRLSLQLEDHEVQYYNSGTILKIPFETKMDARNTDSDILELTVVKAPAPKA